MYSTLYTRLLCVLQLNSVARVISTTCWAEMLLDSCNAFTLAPSLPGSFLTIFFMAVQIPKFLCKCSTDFPVQLFS